MFELTQWNIASFILAGVGLGMSFFALRMKRRLDQLNREIDQSRAEEKARPTLDKSSET